MIPIPLGTNRYGTTINYWEPLSYNVIIVVAKPRYGKSVIIKNLYTQIAQYRRILIFDYQGEHSDTQWGNWESKDKVAFIPDLHTIKDFGFYLNEFDQLYDWVSLGFSEKAAFEIRKILQCWSLYENSPERVMEIIQQLPVRKEDIEPFNDKYAEYGLSYPIRVHDSVQQALASAFEFAYQEGRGIIIPPVGSPEHTNNCPNRIHIEDWEQELIDHPHLNVDLDIQSDDDVGRARAGVGKILSKLVSVLPRLKPLIVIEEADFVCPSDQDLKNITSRHQLQKYVLKEQRKGVELLFITQNPGMLDPKVVAGGTVFIMGQHAPCQEMKDALNEPHLDYVKDVIHKLKANRLLNKREFALMLSGNGGKYDIFEVNDSCTLL